MARCDFTVRRPLEGAQVSVDVKISKEFWLRFWLGTRLIMLGAWVMGCRIEITHNAE